MTRDNRLVALSLFVWGLGEGLTIYVRPLYLKQLGADPVAIGFILSLAGVMAGLSHIPAGYLADRLGRKPVLLAAWIMGTLTAGLMFLAQDLGVFVIGLLGYTFTGFVLAPLNSYVAEARGGQSVQRALTLVSAGFWAGNIFSPAIGGLIGQAAGLRTVYGLMVGVFAISTLLILPLSPQPRQPHVSARHRYAPLLANRSYLGFLGLMLAALFAIQVGLPLAPNFVVEQRELNLAQVGLLGSAASLGAVALNLGLGHHMPRRGFMLGQVLAAAFTALLLTTSGMGWLALAFFCQAGWNLAHNMGVAQVSRVVSSAEIGLALGLYETVSAAALTLGPLAAGLLYAQAPALPFQVSLGLILLSLPLVWRLAPRHSDVQTALSSDANPAAPNL